MTLLLDIGNTRIKWALRDGQTMSAPGEAVHAGDPDIALAALFAQVSEAPAEIAAANVAGDVFMRKAMEAVSTRWDMSIAFAETQREACGVRNGYEDHRKLGVDRWLAIIGATAGQGDAVCVVDAGTAVTFDLVAAGGRHLGGYIIPGIDLMLRSLERDTGDLRRLAAADDDAHRDSRVIGRNTRDAIGHGGVAAICALVERCVEQLAQDNDTMRLILTGGDATRLLPHLGVEAEHRPHLVLEGLARYEVGGDSR